MAFLFYSIMKSKKKNLFVSGDIILQNSKKQTLEIEFIDYTRNVYVFKEEWIHNLSKFKSYDIDYIDTNFKKAD